LCLVTNPVPVNLLIGKPSCGHTQRAQVSAAALYCQNL
jgi:hypothetical protein